MTSVHSRVVINMQGVDKLFGDFKALDSVSLQVHEGEKMVICGPSGSGKSTLIRCINGLEDIHADLRSVKRDEFRAKNIGVVFQQFNLFPYLSVIENIKLAVYFSGIGHDVFQERCQELFSCLSCPVNSLVANNSAWPLHEAYVWSLISSCSMSPLRLWIQK